MNYDNNTLFNAETRYNHNTKYAQSNKQILSYHLYNDKYNMQKNTENNEQPYFDRLTPQFSNNSNNAFINQKISKFNKELDQTHVPIDIQRPQCTRFEAVIDYDLENDKLKPKNPNQYTNDYYLSPIIKKQYDTSLDMYF